MTRVDKSPEQHRGDRTVSTATTTLTTDEAGRPRPPERLPRPDHETPQDARRRQRLNKQAFDEYLHAISELCSRCWQVRTHVNHEPDPATSIEGPEYYADFLDELHEFEPSGKWTR